MYIALYTFYRICKNFLDLRSTLRIKDLLTFNDCN